MDHVVNHFPECKRASTVDRTFWRSDQLVSHMERMHGVKDLPKVFQLAWSSDNPDFRVNDLRCGFCGLLCSTWQERKDNVSEHIRAGAHKDDWWPQREYMPSPQAFEDVGPVSNDQSFSDEIARSQRWSCRVLDNYRSLGTGYCILCTFYVSPFLPVDEQQRQHAATHKLRECSQSIYWSQETFNDHLVQEHGKDPSIPLVAHPWHHSRSLNGTTCRSSIAIGFSPLAPGLYGSQSHAHEARGPDYFKDHKRMIPSAPSDQGSIQMMTIMARQVYNVQVPVDVQAAARVADEKKKRNIGAAARCRARRKKRSPSKNSGFKTLCKGNRRQKSMKTGYEDVKKRSSFGRKSYWDGRPGS
jgi:hypothetical protein